MDHFPVGGGSRRKTGATLPRRRFLGASAPRGGREDPVGGMFGMFSALYVD